ncbi:MAG: hypothetical protein ACOC5G_04505 [Acidobacteriota bacterium]
MRIRATILEMASSEILNYIPAGIYERIRRQDKKPEFRAYIIGHEGESEGKVIGAGNIIKRWFKSAIEKITEKLQFGTKIFHEHGETNKHKGREAIGEIVGKTSKYIKDKLSAIAIAYIKPEFRNLPLDVASIEADVFLSGDQNTGIYDADVEGITGVALGNSAVNRPGFPGATLLSQIQAFAQSQTQKGERGMEITISEVRDFIKAESLKPSDLFGLRDLSKDPSFKEEVDKAFTDRKDKINEGFDKTKEELIKKYEEKLKEKDEKIKDNNETITKLQRETIQSKTKDWLETQKEKRELDDEQLKFLNRNIPKFKPEDSEKAEDEFNKFLDDQLDELKEIKTEIFGQEDKSNKSKTSGGEPKDKKGDEDDIIEDMSLED